MQSRERERVVVLSPTAWLPAWLADENTLSMLHKNYASSWRGEHEKIFNQRRRRRAAAAAFLRNGLSL